MKKAILLCILIQFSFINHLLTAQEYNNQLENKGYDFLKITPYAGFERIKITESFFYKPEEELITVSRLDWLQKIIPYTGIKAEWIPHKYFFLQADANFAIPIAKNIKLGLMEDYDWMNIYSTGDYGLTHYSIDENKVKSFINTDIKIGNRWPISDFFTLTNYADFSFEYFCFEAWNGYKQYAKKTGTKGGYSVYEAWTSDIEKKATEGRNIEYKGAFYFLGLGCQLDFSLFNRLDISLSQGLNVSLYSFQNDYHIKRQLLIDFTEQALFNIKSQIYIQYRIKNNHKLGIAGSLNYIDGDAFKVNIYHLEEEYWESSENLGGFGQLLFSLSLCYTYSL